jgi:serine/threonine protein phosphatase 1
MQIKDLDLRGFKGRIFFTTDLHGHYNLLHEKLKEVAFNGDKDILLVGGDLCDRGPDSQYVLDYLNEPWFISIMGNHEKMLIDAYENPSDRNCYEMLFLNGGEWFYNIPKTKQKAIYDSFKELPLAIKVITDSETVGIVHAQCPYDDWEEFSKMTKAEIEWDGAATSQWARSNYLYRKDITIGGVDRLLVGHSPTSTGEVEVIGNTWYCDLGSFFRDKLCLLEIGI